MIALSVNKYIWNELKKDAQLNASYDKYRATFGANFIPFFPVYDNHAGDISWGNECYILYDQMKSRPTRQVFKEQHTQVIYTIVGPLPDLFDFTDMIVGLFDDWENTSFVDEQNQYRINDIKVWQPDRTRGRDKVRQTYSTTLIFDVHYISC